MLRYALLALALAAPAHAQTPGTPDVKRVQAGTYNVDSAHTQVLWEVDHLGFSLYSGMFVEPTGTLTIDPANPGAAKVDIVFPIAKSRSSVAAMDKHLHAADIFDAAKYPEGRFVSTRVVVRGTNATITGNLTLRGVTKPVTLSARFFGAGPAPLGEPKLNIGFAATGTIKRSDFGLGYAAPAVGDTVKLTINAAFVKQ